MGRTSWIRCILVLGCAIVTLVILGTATQVSQVSAYHAPSGPTFTLVVKNIQVSVIKVQSRGQCMDDECLGDERVGHSQLYTEQGTQVGRIDFLYIITDLNAKPGMIALKTMRTFTLPEGTIEIAGVSYRASITSLAPRDVSAITGGTGKYVGATGQVVTQTSSAGVTTEAFYLAS